MGSAHRLGCEDLLGGRAFDTSVMEQAKPVAGWVDEAEAAPPVGVLAGAWRVIRGKPAIGSRPYAAIAV